MKKSIAHVFIFLSIQAIVSMAVRVVWKLLTGVPDLTVGAIITASVLSNVLALALFLGLRWAEVSPNWLRTRPWMVLAWSVIAAVGLVIPSTWLQEQMPELPNLVEEQFGQVLSNRWGYLAVGLLAPMAEEVVFRGAVLRSLLASFRLPWVAIAISALLFAAVHLNPAQMPHAFLVGMLLGWMYWRTGSILPGMAYHWANNSVAYVIYNVYPDPDLKLIDLFGGSQQHVLAAVGFSMLILLPALYQLHVWMRPATPRLH
ncbi:MAG: CPBP family intramembrane metalloprotease [Prevotella sp.]|nr:CPBP family intramembrane metalloprotease [Prevotella sp.]